MTTQEVKLRRVQCSYQAADARFLLECDFSKQYSYYYRKRLEKTKTYLEVNCRSKWDPTLPLYGLAELAALACGDDDNIVDDLFDEPESSEREAITTPEPRPRPKHDVTEGTPKFERPKRMKYESGEDDGSMDQRRTSTQNAEAKSPTISIGYPLTPTESPILQESRVPIVAETTVVAAHKDCIVIGTISKRMKLQPDVVNELCTGDFNVKVEQYLGHYTSKEDRLVLEDADESISLTGTINPQRFVTGIVVALLGHAIDEGSSFLVKDICYAEPDRQLLYEDETSALDISSTTEYGSDPGIDTPLSNKQPIYLMVVSGLGFHQDMKKRSLLTRALQDMIDFIWGGSKFAKDDRSSRVARILVAGDSLLESRLLPDEEYSSQKNEDIGLKMKQSRQVKPYHGSVQAIKHMDDFFAQLSKTINVDVMPGASDPSTHLMPQQPFHPCMFPKSCMFSTFNCITNPHHAIYNSKVEVFATSGQNIDIVSKFSGIADPIEVMKCHLMWGNCAPNAPDNLYSCPYEDEDPYVIDFIPELYIAGCQEHYRIDYYCYSSDKDELTNLSIEFDDNDELVEGEFITETQKDPVTPSQENEDDTQETTIPPIRHRNPLMKPRKSCTVLVTVPKFCETLSCVLINLLNLESHLLSFK